MSEQLRPRLSEFLRIISDFCAVSRLSNFRATLPKKLSKPLRQKRKSDRFHSKKPGLSQVQKEPDFHLTDDPPCLLE